MEENQKQDLKPGTIIFENVSKRFRKFTISQRAYSTLKTRFVSFLLGKPITPASSVTALKSISLKIEPGTALGIIGRNGSGKSTMLKLLAGIYQADVGQVHVSGKISALIELGAGFHPDFTGRENVYLNGVMYGLTRKQIDERMEDIVRYAELEDCIDDPVRTYSSGMYMRLGFSVAVFTDPDVLLIDEVLAVGDATFTQKCHETLSDFRRQGKTMILVTHDLSAVERWCDEAIWLEKGKVMKRGEPRFVIDSYRQLVAEEVENALLEANSEAVRDSAISTDTSDSLEIINPAALHENKLGQDNQRWGNRDVEITSVRMRDAHGAEKWAHSDNAEVVVEVDYSIHRQVRSLVFGIGILRADGVCVHGTNTQIEGLEIPLPEEALLVGHDHPQAFEKPYTGTFRYVISRLSLIADTYLLDIAAHQGDGFPFDYHHRMYKFSVTSNFERVGVYSPDHQWTFDPRYVPAEHIETKRKFAVGGV